MSLSSYLATRSNPGFNVGFHNISNWEPDFGRIFSDLIYSSARHFDLDETDEAFLLTLKLPGFKQSDTEVTLNRDVLTVSAKRNNRSYNQSVTIPEGVDPNKIEAKLEDGLLMLILGKQEIAKPRKIAVK